MEALRARGLGGPPPGRRVVLPDRSRRRASGLSGPLSRRRRMRRRHLSPLGDGARSRSPARDGADRSRLADPAHLEHRMVDGRHFRVREDPRAPGGRSDCGSALRAEPYSTPNQIRSIETIMRPHLRTKITRQGHSVQIALPRGCHSPERNFRCSARQTRVGRRGDACGRTCKTLCSRSLGHRGGARTHSHLLESRPHGLDLAGSRSLLRSRLSIAIADVSRTRRQC